MRKSAVLWLMLAFTRADGVPIWIDSDQIVSVTIGGDGYCAAKLANITTTFGHQCVRESASVVALAVDNAKTHGHALDGVRQ